MARKSRKNRNVESNIQTVVKKENLLDTAAYIRLSVENGGNETDETLVVQQMLVERFIEEHPDLRLEEVYIDNGFTGTNFERPGFMRLMEDVRSGKVQCIVVKDLSRFGRDYLETGYYLETILPKLNVRFIAITDDYDSSRKEDRENISVPIKNMVNAMYAKDMSKKILEAKEAQKRNGNITLSKVAFGYVRSEDKTRQVVDETVASVVRMIFQWTLLGVNKREIADRLGLDMAINNLVNNLYSKDISKKLKSALKVKWKNGKWTGSKPPFGYLKDEEHGCWKIDPVAGKYVRMIFDKAMEGCNTSQICYYMNEQKVPTPGKYNQMNGLLRQGNYKMPDKEVVWDTGMIRTILGRFEYTGALVMGRRHTVAIGSKVTRKTAERDVVIRKNINPAIITEEEYEVASASIMFMTKPEYRGAKDFLLKGKVRCGNCHRSLAYTDGGIHPKIYCPHKAQAGRYSHCSEDAYPVSVIEGHIWYSLKRILRILDSVQRESEEKYTDNSFTGKRQQRVLESELEKLKNERIHQYEAYAEGVLSREKYITVKKQLTETIEKIQSEQKALASVIIEEERYRSRIRTAVQQLEVQIERGKLTKEIIDTMIDTVYVYDKKRIEVILRFDDVLQKVISEYMQGAKGA